MEEHGNEAAELLAWKRQVNAGGEGGGGRRKGDLVAAARAIAAATATAAAAAHAAEVVAHEEQSIYVPGGRGAGLREGLPPKKAKPSALWWKPVSGNFKKVDGRFKVVLAGREDLQDAGALCIKVRGFLSVFFFFFTTRMRMKAFAVLCCLRAGEQVRGR